MSSKPHATKQPRSLEIVVHQRETPFVGLRAHLRERGLLIPPTLPRASWEPPAAHYPLHDPSDEVVTGDGEFEIDSVPQAAPSARRPAFSLPTSLPSSAPPAPPPQKPVTPAPAPMLPPPVAVSKPASVPMMPAFNMRPPTSNSMQLPPLKRAPSSPMIPALHNLPTAGYDSSQALAGLGLASTFNQHDPPTAELKFKEAEALLHQAKHGPGAMPVDDSPRTSRAEQHNVQLDLSEWGFTLSLSFISQSADSTPLELIRALRSELGHYLAHEVDQPHLLNNDRVYTRQAEQRILRFFGARMPQYPVVSADLSPFGG